MKSTRFTVFAAAIVGLTATTAYAGVNHWTRRGLEGRVVNCLAVSPTNPSEVYAGAYTPGARGDLQKTTDGGQNWAAASRGLEGMFVRELAMDTSVPEGSLYAVAGSGSVFEDQLFSSANRGQTWASLNRKGVSVVVNSTNPRELYSGYVGGIGYTRDAGAAWKESSIPLRRSQWIAALALDPRAPSTIYASGSDADIDYPESVPIFKSTDSGSTWRAVGGDFAGTAVLAVDPSDSSHILAGAWSGVFVSGDAGQTWSITSPERTLALAVDPVHPGIVYAGTATAGVQRSLDGGLHWRALNSGLTGRSVFSLAIDASGLFLYAGTADGVFGLEVAAGPLDVSITQDGDTRFFSFDVSSGRVVFGSVDTARQMTVSQPFGPYSGWTPRASASGGDGLTRILWSHEDGSAALWLLGHFGIQASFRYEAIPGLGVFDVAAGANANTHILWTGIDGAVVLQTVDASGAITSQLSLGPYAGWSATAIADGPDGLTRLLWSNDDGRAGLSLVSSEGILATGRLEPEAGWRALDVAVGGDGLTRILATRQHEQITLWTLWTAVVAEITPSEIYPIYSALPGVIPRRLAVGPDGSSRILFTGPGGGAALSFLSPSGVEEGLVSLTPTPGSGVDISGDWTGPFQTNDDADCHSDPSASATFYQNGSVVTGSIRAIQNTCGFGGNFTGTLVGSQLTGTLTKGPFGPASVSGTVSSSELLLVVGDLWSGNHQIPGGKLNLHR